MHSKLCTWLLLPLLPLLPLLLPLQTTAAAVAAVCLRQKAIAAVLEA
jgi:hypothetical protein